MQIYFLEVSYTYAKAKQDGVNVHMAGYLTSVSGEIRRDTNKWILVLLILRPTLPPP